MAGTQPSRVNPLLGALAASGAATSADSPVAALAVLAETAANRSGATLTGIGLRLVDEHLPAATGEASAIIADALDTSRLALGDVAAALGTLYEQLLAPKERKSAGAHFTPLDIAGALSDAVLKGWRRSSAPEVLDPSCGGGAFLLAAADRLVARWQLSRTEATGLLYGVDIDPAAVAIAEVALGLWCLEAGEQPIALDRLRAADGLIDPLPDADLVVGNPPFLNQLEGRTARTSAQRAAVRDRFADLVGPYGDTAALFLLAGGEVLRPGGRMTLIQPQSILASRDTRGIRAWLTETLALRGLWFCTEQLFDAAVRVCAPVLERPLPAASVTPVRLERWTGPAVEAVQPRVLDTDEGAIASDSWGPLVADLAGVPSVNLDGSVSVGAVANVTAGFRDQFYGFADHTSEATDSPSRNHPAAVTVGMIDPLHLRWGTGSFKYAGKTWERPVVDLGEVEAADPVLAQWARDRLQPKLLVATQTRVVEVIADPAGVHLPITPVISVEPTDETDSDIEASWTHWWSTLRDSERVWLLAAALMAPPVTAWARAYRLGTALSGDALKLSATDVASIPLPTDHGLWQDGAACAQEAQAATTPETWEAALVGLGSVMSRAYGFSGDDPLVAWWVDRLPNHR